MSFCILFYILIVFTFHFCRMLSPHEAAVRVTPDLYYIGRLLAVNYCINVKYPEAAVLLIIFLYF